MTTAPRALVLRTAGTNCDAEMVRAFQLAGADARRIHLDRLIESPSRLDDFDILGFPGGFSYGDDVASGRVLATRARERLWPALADAANRGALMIGVCNGFQVMAQIGLLPGPERAGEWSPAAPPARRIGLAENAGARFIDRWLRIEVEPDSPCVWTRGLARRFSDPDALLLPIAHGEGRVVAADEATLASLESERLIALRYGEGHNANGSQSRIAGVCDRSGRIFGLMPHPERSAEWLQHPYWTRLEPSRRTGDTLGLAIFRNAVEAALEHAPA